MDGHLASQVGQPLPSTSILYLSSLLDTFAAASCGNFTLLLRQALSSSFTSCTCSSFARFSSATNTASCLNHRWIVDRSILAFDAASVIVAPEVMAAIAAIWLGDNPSGRVEFC